MEQLAQVSIQMGNEFEDEGGITVLADFEGFSFLQMAHVPSKENGDLLILVINLEVKYKVAGEFVLTKLIVLWMQPSR